MSFEKGKVWVGTLAQEKGEFYFTYSSDFRGRDDLPAIPAFPDKEREYRSKLLWPFFQARLPSLSRPEIEKLVKDRDLDPGDTFVLLGELGRRAVNTPYEFELREQQLAPAVT